MDQSTLVIPDGLRPLLLITGIPAGEQARMIGLVEHFATHGTNDPGVDLTDPRTVLVNYQLSGCNPNELPASFARRQLIMLAEKPTSWSWNQNLATRRSAIKALGLRYTGSGDVPITAMMQRIINEPNEDHRVRYLAIWAYQRIAGAYPTIIPTRLLRNYERYFLNCKAEEEGLCLL